MNYRETLEFAKANKVDIAKLMIANEVECVFKSNSRFEDKCQAIYNLWLKTEGITINQLCLALQYGITKGELSLDRVLKYEEDFDEVIELAIQCDNF